MRLIVIILISLFISSCSTTNVGLNGKEIDRGEVNPNGFSGEGIGLGNTETIGHGAGGSYEELMSPSPIIEVDKLVMYEEQPMAYPEMVQATPSTDELRIIEVSNNKITSSTTTGGHVAYKIPTEMTVRSTYQVIVRISKSKVNIYENLNGEVKTSTIPITETMEVKVIDPSPSDDKMFEVIPDNQPVQLVENNEDVTQWTFNVTPVRSGSSKLKVVISIIKNGFLKEVVYEDDVTVKTDVTKTIPFFIATYWQWIMTTLVIPFIVWFVKRKKKKDE